MEIIIIDDDSDFNVRNRLSDYLDHENLKLIINESNMGANWSRRRGIQESVGEVVAFLDDDDVWDETKIEKQINLMKSEGAGDVITCGIEYTNSDHGRTKKPKNNYRGHDLIKKLLKFENCIGGFSCVLVDKGLIAKAGLPDPKLAKSQDIEWYIRLAKHSDFSAVQEALVKYDADETRERLTDISIEEKTKAHKIILDKHDELINRHGIVFKRKVHSRYYLTLGKRMFRNGKSLRAMESGLKSAFQYPLYTQPYLLVVLSMLGGKGIYLAKLFRKVVS